MVIDTSALLALLLEEPEARRIAKCIMRNRPRLISAATLLETGIVILSRRGETGARDLDLTVSSLRFEIVPVTVVQVHIARRAFREYGKGRHRACLNLGDCFSYALARETGQPLLFKGNDFSQTDLEAVPY